MPQSIPKYTFSKCRTLREHAGLSMSRLAGVSEVSRDLIRSLEKGNPHSRHKVMAVFNALQQLHDGSLREEDELFAIWPRRRAIVNQGAKLCRYPVAKT